MEVKPTEADGKQALLEHVLGKAHEARVKYGSSIGREVMMRLLLDRSVVRYPLGVRYDSQPLRAGEFACLEPLGAHPSDGFCLYIHPMFEPVDELLPLLIAYYIPTVNYGEVVSHVEAEVFGSTLSGLDREEYYKILCSVADSVPPPAPMQ